MHFYNPNISIATAADICAIKDLLNSAYRGEASKQGWTTEAHLISGDTRTDEKNVQEVMTKPGSVFLICKHEQQKIIACLNLQEHGSKLYLGMFAVSPQLQGAGMGKELLKASEEYALKINAIAIYMTVISLRTELVNWYQRHGYADTGERKAFLEDGLTGKQLRPLEFMVLEKFLSKR